VLQSAAVPGQPGHDADCITARLAVSESAMHLARRNPAAAVAPTGQRGGAAEQEAALARTLLSAGRCGRAADTFTRVSLAPLDAAMPRSQAPPVRAQTASHHNGDHVPRPLCQALQQTGPQDIAPLCDPPMSVHRRPLAPSPESRRGVERASNAPPPPEPLPAVVEPLSERECEVLRQAAQLQSNAEIAAELHVSVNTVKSHLKSVNRKLCVSRRRDAVRRARQLKLV